MRDLSIKKEQAHGVAWLRVARVVDLDAAYLLSDMLRAEPASVVDLTEVRLLLPEAAQVLSDRLYGRPLHVHGGSPVRLEALRAAGCNVEPWRGSGRAA